MWTTRVLGLLSLASLGAAGACDSASFNATASVAIASAIAVRSLVVGAEACFQVTCTEPSAQWVSIGFAASSKMVNSPVTNAVVFKSASTSVQLYALGDYSASGITLQADQSAIRVAQAASVNGVATFTFSRALAGSSADVALTDGGETTVLWAYGTSAWPAYHAARGATRLVLSSGVGPAQVFAAASTVVTTYTVIIVAAAFVTLLAMGLIATHAGDNWRVIHHKTLLAPPGSSHAAGAVLQPLADVKVGEWLVVAVYIATLAIIGASVNHQFVGASATRAASLTTGHLALAHLMLLLLPVARGKHWELAFGIAPDRILKFHRALGRVGVLLMLAHLLLNAVDRNVTTATAVGTQEAVPLYGFLAFLAFASMGLVAFEPIRRRWYEAFLYFHRVAAVAGIVLAMLHSMAVVYGMIFPLVIYGLSALGRLRAFFNRFEAHVEADAHGTVTLLLPSTPQTKRWAETMNPCSFFYVCIPSISATEWHPFSAIVSPKQDSIGFCIKAPKKGSFGDKVCRAAATSPALSVLVGGPYGKLSVDIAKYDRVVMVCGGVGVTPMLSVVNQSRDDKRHRDGKFVLHWVVRAPSDLLMADSLMHPLPLHVTSTLYVSTATAGSSARSLSGEDVAFLAGRPVLDEILNHERFLGEKVCVLACGPPSLVADVQRHAYELGFPFHKEVFAF
ncbi:hypothetical protein SPRG_00047 [Saprolegnia parasitica CBS 223.65]|uniref:DOMON domain-containing protein n=1 Tax=Saprolegnia parasitica (strain CBS 223.65) TaxID=695850 RepID=A0A067D9B4_SAPPC|nr:hypothetical protein SPRG_00047 [Saprolegnia parasitica CBS 223.65]KDO35201.1 hypothetical protein SPRG_00047 [Saprolegnia parasitica CBS 223.65]|eukprot:XP_012193553.1 hypothetical protein SPRG_00047 [Saprolegnia parasitica CBS 223.65]